jgi:hypothetical protein
VDTILRVDARLEVGATTESVTVTAASPLLKTDRTDVSSTLTSKEGGPANSGRLCQQLQRGVLEPHHQ